MERKPYSPPDDDARSNSGESEDDALFQGVTSSVSRGSAEATTFSRSAARDGRSRLADTDPEPFGVGGKEFDYEASASASITSVPYEQIGVTRDGKATEFHYPARTTYRGFSGPEGPTLVESQNMFGAGPMGLRDEGKLGDDLGAAGATGHASGASTLAELEKKVPGIAKDAPIPKLAPYYRLETHTHARLSQTSDDAVMQARLALCLSLQEQGVDFEFKPDKCKWKCAYACAVGTTVCLFFVVRFWRRDSGDTVVEFQRRHGDASAFLKIYRATLQGLGLGSPVSSRPSPPAMMGGVLAPPPLAPSVSTSALDMDLGLAVPSMSGGVGITDDDVTAFVQPLKEMLQTRTLDCTLEATRALARLSACKDNRVALYQAGIITELDSFVREESADAESLGLLHTAATVFAITCLANLSEEPMVQPDLCRICADVLLDQVRNGAYADRAMRREAARTLRNLCSDDVGADAFIRKVGKDRLQTWSMDTPDLVDESMKNDAAFVKECLQKRWVACS